MSFFSSFKKLVGINNVYDNHTTKEHFHVGLTDRYGPLPNPSCIAYDSHNSILAVGSNKGGIIKVYGRPGAELTLRSQNRGHRISSLTFLPETGHLLVASDTVLEVFNLGSGQIQAGLNFDAVVTCVSYFPSCAFIYVGLSSGDVNIVNVDGWTKSLYRISQKELEVPPGSNSLAVVSVAINPDRDDIILIGIACGAVNEWEIKTRKVLRRHFGDKFLSALTWDPSGNKFLVGQANGEIVQWTRKKTIADEIYYPIPNPQKPNPVKKLFWLANKSNSSETTLVTLGGTDSYHGIVIDKQKQKQKSFVPLSEPGIELRDACVIFSSGKESALNSSSSSSGSSSSTGSGSNEPVGIIAVNAKGHIFVHALNGEIDEKGLLPSCNAPLPFSLSSVSILDSIIVSEPLELLRDLVATCNIDPSDAMKGQTSNLAWPLTGGVFTIDPSNSPVILITLLSNNTIVFWDLSMRNCRVPIYRIRLPGTYSAGSTLIFDFCPVSRVLHIGNGHEVFVYHFSLESRAIELVSIDDSVGAPPIERLPSPSPQSSPSAARAPESPQPEAPPRSVVLDEARPTPPTTISDSAPSSPRSPPNDSVSTASSASSSPNALNSSATTLAKSSGSAAASPPASTPTSPTSSRTLKTPMPTQSPGFQFVYSISIESKSIQCIRYESGLRLLAVSTVDGRVRVYNATEDYARVYTHNPPANTLPCPPIVTHLQFCETVVNGTEEHLVLIMGLDLGSVLPISLTNPSRLFKPIAARKSPVVDIHLVRHRGDHMQLWKRPWKSGEEAKYVPSHQTPKHLVVCTVNDVRTYKIPEFEMVMQYECPAPIAWYGTINVNVEVQGKMESEYVIAAIDMGSNVLFIRLMNLTLVSYAGPNNLTRMGVEGISPMSTPHSCCLLDGTVVLHTDTFETYIVKLLPFTERRALTQLLGLEPPKAYAKKSKGIKGFLGKDKDVNFEEVFGPRKEDPVISSSSSSSASSSATPEKSSTSAAPRRAATQGQIGEVKGVMADNIEKLNQRGQKLSDMADRSQQMAEASGDFASLARQLAEQQKKSWF